MSDLGRVSYFIKEWEVLVVLVLSIVTKAFIVFVKFVNLYKCKN